MNWLFGLNITLHTQGDKQTKNILIFNTKKKIQKNR